MAENIEEYISRQLKEHTWFDASFKPAPFTMMNEVIHPRTGKIITQNQKYAALEKDRDNRVKRIIKKVQDGR